MAKARILTQAFIDSIKPTDERVEYPDTKAPGLRHTVQPSDARSWEYRFRWASKTAKATFGSYPPVDLKTARNLARKAAADVANSIDPRAKRRDAKAARTSADDLVETAVERFIRRHVKSLKSAPEVERLLRREVIKPWGKKRLKDIVRQDVRKLLDGILDRPAPVLANRVRSYLKTFFAWAIDEDLVQSSPVDKIRTPTKEVSRDRVLADAELRSVWLATEALGSPFGPVLQLLILTGQRLGEVAGMRWSELDLSSKLWSLPKERVKNKKAHVVPLSSQALAIIEAVPKIANCDFVFTTNGRTAVIGFSKIKRALDALLPDMKPWRLHDLRRSMATGCARLGVDIVVIEKILNHSSGVLRGVVGTYQRHGFEDERRVALDKWGRHIATLVAGKAEDVVIEGPWQKAQG
jgi:integrase